MTLLSVLAGSALVLLVGLDVGLTVLHPAARGPLSHLSNRATWLAVRALAANKRVLSYAGPLAMATNVASWVSCLWLGFALVYLPWAGDLIATGELGEPAAFEAFYLSATALTTVGFGDVVAGSDALRLISAFQAGTGFGAFTAAIAFVLSVYPLVTDVRASALHVADLGGLEVESAARLVAIAREEELSLQLRSLTESHEHVRRFPVLYYFESGDEDETLTTLLRGTCMTALVLRWGMDAERFPPAAVYAPAFERALDRLLTDLEDDFIGDRGRREPSPDAGDADERLARLRTAVRRAAPDLAAADDGGDTDEFGRFLARAERVTAAFAREHRQQPAPLI